MPRPSRPWFRVYVEIVHDRKLRRQKPEHRWLFLACLAAARQSPVPGVLLVGEDDPMTLEDIADFAGMPTRQVAAGLAALVTAGVLDVETEGPECYFVPAWGERQFESDDVTARTAKHRGRNVPTPFQGTAPETEAETESEKPPQPPAERGAQEAVAHDGSHRNCRACGTNRRGPLTIDARSSASSLVPAPSPYPTIEATNGLLAELASITPAAPPPRAALTREGNEA